MSDRKRKKQSRRSRRSNSGSGGQRRPPPRPVDTTLSGGQADARRVRNRAGELSGETTTGANAGAVEATPGLALGDLSHVSRDLVRILALAAIMLVLLAAATVALG